MPDACLACLACEFPPNPASPANPQPKPARDSPGQGSKIDRGLAETGAARSAAVFLEAASRARTACQPKSPEIGAIFIKSTPASRPPLSSSRLFVGRHSGLPMIAICGFDERKEQIIASSKQPSIVVSAGRKLRMSWMGVVDRAISVSTMSILWYGVR